MRRILPLLLVLLLLTLTGCQTATPSESPASSTPTTVPVTQPSRTESLQQPSFAIPSDLSLPGGVTENDLMPDISRLYLSKKHTGFLRPLDITQGGNYDTYKQRQGDDTEYLFTFDTGEYIGFQRPKQTEEPQTRLSYEQLVDITDTLVSVVSDLERYTGSPECQYTDYPNGEKYYITYHRFVDQYETNEEILFTVSPDGTVLSMRCYNTGLYDNLPPPKLDDALFAQALEAELQHAYDGAILSYSVYYRELLYYQEQWYFFTAFSSKKLVENQTVDYLGEIYVPIPTDTTT